MERSKMKVCFAASSGGHFEQLMMLRPLMDRYDSFILTEKTAYKAASSEIPVCYVKQVNRREILFLFKIIVVLIQTIAVFMKERPDAVICTGALATLPMCLLGKAAGKKIIFVESFAKISSPTICGKVVYKFADQFYIQWETLREIYPDGIFLGGIY